MAKLEEQRTMAKLEEKTLPQLLEILQRQENLISNQKLLKSLPDKGLKVQSFFEKIKHIVCEKQKEQTSRTEPSSDDRVSKVSPTNHQSDSAAPQHGEGSIQSIKAASPVSKIQPPVKTQSAEDSPGVGVGGRGEAPDSAQVLSDRLDGLTLAASTSDERVNTERMVTAAAKFTNSYEAVMKRVAVAGSKRPAFKPHSSLKIDDIHQLPDKFKQKSKVTAISQEEGAAPTPWMTSLQRDNLTESRLAEESAVRGPTYKFAGAKPLSMNQSVLLQRQQRAQLEETKSRHAAERLSERLDIKSLVYEPLTTDMDYRSNTSVQDSDDESDEG